MYRELSDIVEELSARIRLPLHVKVWTERHEARLCPSRAWSKEDDPLVQI
jgi:hypothetical protein